MEDFSHTIVEFYEKLSSWEQEVVKDTGITVPQMHVIEVLGNCGPIRMKDLAEKLGVVMGTLTVMIKRLSKLNMVIRKENPDDLRSFHVMLTEEGTMLYEEHHKHHLLLAEEISTHLTEDEQIQFNMLLIKVLESM